MMTPKLPESLSQAAGPLRSWAAQRRIGAVLLAIAGVAAVVLGFKVFFGEDPQPAPVAEYRFTPDTPTGIPAPTYTSTYPAEIFTAKSTPRATVAGTNSDIGATTFRGLSSDDIKNGPKIIDTSSSVPQTVVKDRQYLAQHGYSWSPEGFLSSARKGDIEALQTYLRAGMPPNTRNAFSSTALHAAAESNNIEAAKVLIAAGANLNTATTNLQTPLHRAVSQNLAAMTELLLLAGANPRATTLEGWTPMFYAVDNNNQALMDTLIAAGSNVNATDRFGNTAITLAVRKNYINLVQRLIYLGAKVNTADLANRTPLHYAVGGGYYQLTKLLLENGADTNLRDKSGLTPMDIALANQDLALANLLLANGSKRPQVLGTKAVGIKPPKPVQPLTPAQIKSEAPPSNPKTYNLGPAPSQQQNRRP